MVYTRLRFTKN